jgi:hypothetical protein
VALSNLVSAWIQRSTDGDASDLDNVEAPKVVSTHFLNMLSRFSACASGPLFIPPAATGVATPLPKGATPAPAGVSGLDKVLSIPNRLA